MVSRFVHFVHSLDLSPCAVLVRNQKQKQEPKAMPKKRGPAPKPAEEQRTKRISVYFSEAEYEAITQLARNKHDLCNYIRAQVLAGKTPVSVSIPEINLKAYREMGQAGSNLNQIARHMNAGAPIELQQLLIEISAYRLTLIEQPS